MRRPAFDPTWPPEVQAVYRHDLQEIWDPTIASNIWIAYHHQLDLYCSLVGREAPLAILDVGCAQATLALLLAERGHRVCALDIRQPFLAYAASRYEKGDIRFLCANIMEADLPERFDLVFANQIIEHLVCPLEFVRRLRAVLKPGGHLVVTTPNGDYCRNRLPSFDDLGDPAQYEARQFTADGDGHFFAYYDASLQRIFREAGFARVETRFFETPWLSGHMKLRYLQRLLPESVLRKLERITLRWGWLARKLGYQLMLIGYRDEARPPG